MTYKDELTKAMDMLSLDERVIFLGQSVAYTGSAIYKSLEKISLSKRLELPIMEDAQMGMSIGLSLNGFVPVSIFPRMDFLLLATNQLVNHLDKIKEISHGEYNPKVIIRTAIGSTTPLYPGLQHCSDYTEAMENLLQNIDVVKLTESRQIVPAYEKALKNQESSLIIEISDYYNKE